MGSGFFLHALTALALTSLRSTATSDERPLECDGPHCAAEPGVGYDLAARVDDFATRVDELRRQLSSGEERFAVLYELLQLKTAQLANQQAQVSALDQKNLQCDARVHDCNTALADVQLEVDRLKDEVERVRSLELEPLQRQLRGEARLHSDLELALTRVRNAEQELHSSRKLFEGRAKIVAHQAKELVSLREQLVSKFRDAKLLERPCPACPVAYCASDENHADLRRSRLSEALWGAEEMAEMREEVNVR